ncbi:MAG: hypothetical protein JOZ94_14280 [Xanthobacteraceae bacterium]|nr:hypothetical protein [Xanthobacteraceae bacterium]MBV9236997.1 hypothetical protein [Xanthobacteraceae bacterium]MBV9629002.1 hypothetical protein [Xanthobacteraceae bacterium]
MQLYDATPKHAALNRQIQDRIGQQLRAMYNDVVAQGIPDRFSELLKKLDEQVEDKNQAPQAEEER